MENITTLRSEIYSNAIENLAYELHRSNIVKEISCNRGSETRIVSKNGNYYWISTVWSYFGKGLPKSTIIESSSLEDLEKTTLNKMI